MRIKVWTVSSSAGDGSYCTELYPSEVKARENLDNEDCMINDKGTEYEWIDEYPSEISWQIIETDEYEAVP